MLNCSALLPPSGQLRGLIFRTGSLIKYDGILTPGRQAETTYWAKNECKFEIESIQEMFFFLRSLGAVPQAYELRTSGFGFLLKILISLPIPVPKF